MFWRQVIFAEFSTTRAYANNGFLAQSSLARILIEGMYRLYQEGLCMLGKPYWIAQLADLAARRQAPIRRKSPPLG